MPQSKSSRARSTDSAPAPAKASQKEALDAETRLHLLDSAVDTLVGEWAEVIPALDRDVRAVAARIARADDRLRARSAAVLGEAGLSENEFRLLAGLLRMGAPHRCAPTEIAGRYVPVTSGGLTGLARRLEIRGLIRRVSHHRDQRSVLVELTDEGLRLARTTMARFAEAESAAMRGLSPAELARGSRFLRKLLHSIEQSEP